MSRTDSAPNLLRISHSELFVIRRSYRVQSEFAPMRPVVLLLMTQTMHHMARRTDRRLHHNFGDDKDPAYSDRAHHLVPAWQIDFVPLVGRIQ